jgi:hypothetical protein
MELQKSYTEPTIKYNVVSACIFRLIKSYKPMEKYYNGLNELVKIVNKRTNFYLRLYYDESIISPLINDNKEWIKLFETLKLNKKVQLVKYTYPIFFDNLYHHGLLGTIVRFVPLFEGLHERTLIVDLDLSKTTLTYRFKIFDTFVNEITDLHFLTYACYNLNDRFNNLQPKNYNIDSWTRIVASFIIAKVKPPKSIFYNFLKQLENKSYPITEFIKTIENNDKSSMSKTPSSYLYYGIDEFFINYYYLKWFIDNKYKISLTVSASRGVALYLFYKNLKHNNIDIYYKFMKKLLGVYYNNNLTEKENNKILERLIWKDHHLFVTNDDQKKLLYVREKFTKLVNELDFLKFKKLNIEPNLYDCMRRNGKLTNSSIIDYITLTDFNKK